MKKLVLVTSPTPGMLATVIFNDNDFHVRIVSFNSVAKKFSVSFNLKFDHKIDNFSSLYSINIHLDNGQHHFIVEGDLNDSFNFSIGQKTGPFSEVKFSPSNGPIMIVWLIIFTIYQFIVLFVTFCPFKSSNASIFCKRLINGEKVTSFHMGPIVTGLFHQKLLLLFVTIYPYVFQFGIEIIEG